MVGKLFEVFEGLSFSKIQPLKSLKSSEVKEISWVWPPPRMPVTTRILTFLGSGIPINLHWPQLRGGGHSQEISQ